MGPRTLQGLHLFSRTDTRGVLRALRASTAPVLPHQAAGVSPGRGMIGLTSTTAVASRSRPGCGEGSERRCDEDYPRAGPAASCTARA